MVPAGKTSRNSEAVDRGGRKEAGAHPAPGPAASAHITGRPPEPPAACPYWFGVLPERMPRLCRIPADAPQERRETRQSPAAAGIRLPAAAPGGAGKGGNQVPDQETAPVARSFRSPLKNSRQIRQLISGMVAWGRSRTQLYRSMGRPQLVVKQVVPAALCPPALLEGGRRGPLQH